MFGRRNRNDELADKFRELAVKAEDAEIVREHVVSRESQVFRLRDELREVREKNHFTPLFIKTIGGRW